MSSKKRRPSELKATRGAENSLKTLYGSFTWIEEQVDKPDAAIRLAENRTIGIEIVCLESQEYLHYTNKSLATLKMKIPESGVKNFQGNIGTTRVRLFPRISAQKIVNKKNSLYEEYYKSGFENGLFFDEIILLIHTEVISVSNTIYFPAEAYLYTFEQALKDFKINFDRVLIINLYSKECVEVYRKGYRKYSKPSDYKKIDWLQGNYYSDINYGIFHIGNEGGVVNMDGGLKIINKEVSG